MKLILGFCWILKRALLGDLAARLRDRHENGEDISMGDQCVVSTVPPIEEDLCRWPHCANLFYRFRNGESFTVPGLG